MDIKEIIDTQSWYIKVILVMSFLCLFIGFSEMPHKIIIVFNILLWGVYFIRIGFRFYLSFRKKME